MYINPKNQLNTNVDRETEKLMTLLIENGVEASYKPGENIIREGQMCDFFFVVMSGSFRAYRRADDKEMIIGFSFKGDIDTVPHAFITRTHSTENIEAITNSTVIKVFRSTLDSLKSEHPALSGFIEYLLAHYIEILVRRHVEFKTYTAEQLYHRLHERQPDQVRLIPLKYIASYLGISQERLSRIRGKITF